MGDPHQFILGVVGEVDVMAVPRSDAGVGLEEGVHPVTVPGEDHDEIVPLVLHHLEEDLDGFLTVVPLVLSPVQVIGLVDEQHSPHRSLQNLSRSSAPYGPMYWPTRSSRVTDTRWPRAQVPSRDNSSAIRSATVVLPVPGLPVEHMCRLGRSRIEAETPAHLVDEQQRRDFADPRLDGDEADEFPVKTVEDLVHGGVGPLGGEVDEGVVGEDLVSFGGTVAAPSAPSAPSAPAGPVSKPGRAISKPRAPWAPRGADSLPTAVSGLLVARARGDGRRRRHGAGTGFAGR